MTQPVYMRSSNPTRCTPKDLFEKLNDIFDFETDCCASDDNALCAEYFTEDCSFLEYMPKGDVCFMNPPYGRGKNSSGPFIERAAQLSEQYSKTIVSLVAARTGTKWFQRCWDADYIVFIKGQLKFDGLKTNAPFCSVLVIFDGSDWMTWHRVHELSKIGKVIEL